MSEQLSRTGTLQERIDRIAAKAIEKSRQQALGQRAIDFSEPRRREEDVERELRELRAS